MYNEENKYDQLAYRPIPLSNSCQTLKFDDEFLLSDFKNDSLDFSSSVSPSSFNEADDSFDVISDSLFTQILNEYSDESFPEFADLGSCLDFDSNDLDVLSSFLLTDIYELNDSKPLFVQNLEDSNCYSNFDYILNDSNNQVDKLVPLKSNQSNPLQSVSVNNRKRKAVEILLNIDNSPPKKISDQLIFTEFNTSHPTTKSCNRDAAHRYRKKQKLKQSKDQIELDMATDEMLKAKEEMIKMRQSMQTMRNLVSEMLSEL